MLKHDIKSNARLALVGTTLAAGALLASSGCEAPSSPAIGGPIVGAAPLTFTNGDFETGPANMPPPLPWHIQTYLGNNPTGITVQNPQTRAGLNLMMGGTPRTFTIAAVNQPDPSLGPTASLRVCRFNNQCALVNQTGNNHNVNSLYQQMVIGPGDVDPSDGLVHIRFAVAPVLQNPAHPATQQPWYMVQLTDPNTNTLLYSDFNLSAQAGVPWKTINGGQFNEIDYVDWALVDITPNVVMGETVQLEFLAAGCSLNQHFGELYVDGIGASIPGLFVSGTGPQQVNAGSNITYNLNYKNGSATTETGVVIDFTTPPNTTFQGITPPAGASCVTPPVGGTGTIVCTFAGPIPAGAGGPFTITVNVNPGTTTPIVCGTYDIKSNQESPLLGNKITTEVGCTQDSDCSNGNWCHESATIACLPKLANGQPIPSDPPHMNPALNGGCTAQAAALVCVSGVCDAADNDCGYLNGDGPCNQANGGTVCRSGVCDPDGKCGYANGDGPCNQGNQTVVCRSQVCSANGACMPPGGCNVDADCNASSWCLEGMHTCVPKVPNGQPIPSDPPHTNPTLNGTCTALAGATVCVSGVCDGKDDDCGYLNGDGPCTQASAGVVCRSQVCDPNDLKCGYAVGDGPCTQMDATTVCRSGACSQNGLCEPLGGCNVDADCSNGAWCDESMHQCSPKLGNGVSMPVDGPHMNPTLDGTCTQGAATLVCVSGVCDTKDAKCGYANGDGPCDMANGAVVCRSGVCGNSGVCIPPGGCVQDADCGSMEWCNETLSMCSPKLANGTPVPTDAPHMNPTLNGKCTMGAGALVCTSAVCDTKDDECGYANGDGPCDQNNAMVVCRSGACSTDGTCEPAGGCNVDADCKKGEWCNETMHACTPTLANGTHVPTDGPHMNPTLDGKCTMGAGALVCTSAVCDTKDDECGYANGDGPCTDMNGATVCRSTICATSGANKGLCVECVADAQCKAPAKCDMMSNTCKQGCNVDSDCPTGDWCEETDHVCKQKLANGTPIPTDGAHMNPTLNGKCTQEAGALVCTAGVCDTSDDKCGLNDGKPCDNAEQCRSDVCDPTLKVCGKPVGCTSDADCPAADFCDAMHACTPKLPDGQPCGGNDQCINGLCNQNVCDSIIAEGNGAFCATRPGGTEAPADASLALLGLAALAGARRRNRSA